MIHHAVAQGGEDWLRLRLGKPTASEFDRILTPKKKELAAGRHAYKIKLLTELILNMPLDQVNTPSMLHGHDWESKAIAAYEMLEGVDVTPCGFCTTDDGRVGASPDSFVGEDGSLEIKCPEKPEIHVGNLLNPDSFAEAHWGQVQGQLYVTGRKWTDLVSYFIGIPMARVRITPDQEFQAKLAAALKTFLCELSDAVDLARDRGVRFRVHEDEKVGPQSEWLTAEDVEFVIAQRKKEGVLP